MKVRSALISDVGGVEEFDVLEAVPNLDSSEGTLSRRVRRVWRARMSPSRIWVRVRRKRACSQWACLWMRGRMFRRSGSHENSFI